MAFSVGDLVPYNQLPGAVAGQGAEQGMQQFSKGQMDAAQLSEALSKAQTADIGAKMTVDRLPQEIAMKNIQDAQSINTLPPKPGLDDINEAEAAVMGEDLGKRQPTSMEMHKIQVHADEIARQRAPKFDLSDPMGYLQSVQPASNRQMQLEGQQMLYNGRYGIAEMNNEGKNERMDKGLTFKGDQGDKNRATSIEKAKIGAGAVGGGAPTKTMKTTADIIAHLQKTDMNLYRAQGDPSQVTDPVQFKRTQDAVMGAIHLADSHDKTLGDQLRAQYSAWLPQPHIQKGGPLPTQQAPQAPQQAPAKSGRGVDSVDGTPPTEDQGLYQKPKAVTRVVKIGPKAYSVGEVLNMDGAQYVVSEGKNGLGRLTKIGAAAPPRLDDNGAE